MNIKPSHVEEYNRLIRDNRYTTRRLEKEHMFPINLFRVNLPSVTSDEFKKLVEWSGERNATFIAYQVSEFGKYWIASDTHVMNYFKFAEGSKKEKLIVAIADTLKIKGIDLETMAFFETLRDKPHKSYLKGTTYLYPYGKIKIPYTTIDKHPAHELSSAQLEISVLDNWIEIRDKK